MQFEKRSYYITGADYIHIVAATYMTRNRVVLIEFLKQNI